jgi:hypothetical protein
MLLKEITAIYSEITQNPQIPPASKMQSYQLLKQMVVATIRF